ncbi:MAG: hypothetical protein CL902_00770 [Dehalococcoidia bacterium]|nr:hypothetical protein [Dehalococcoidia bacterium]
MTLEAFRRRLLRVPPTDTGRLAVMRAAVSRRNPDLTMVMDGNYDAFARQSQTKLHNLTLAKTYVRLQSADGYDISVVGFDDLDGDSVELTTETVPSQRRKGYNTFMRTAAVIMTCLSHKKLVSEIANWISAYTILKTYCCTVVWKDPSHPALRRFHGPSHLFTTPLRPGEAKRLSTHVRQLTIRPIQKNFRAATRLFMTAPLP